MNIEEVKTIIATVGSGSQRMSTSTSSHLGNISVDLVDLAERDRSTAEVMEEIRQSINIPDVDLSVEEQQGISGGGAPVNVKLLGDDLDILKRETAKATAAIEDIEGLREIDNSLSEGQPEYQIKVCLLYTSPSPRDRQKSRMPSSA